MRTYRDSLIWSILTLFSPHTHTCDYRTTPEEADRWANTGSGLQLAILNALETKWYSYLNTALDDWQNASKFGMPEVLSLSPSVIPYEKDCWPVDGKVKVCNGDYGVTGWEGINAAIVQDKTIVSSAARMNEYYLSRSTAERKQYTMCHELGHAVSLPVSGFDSLEALVLTSLTQYHFSGSFFSGDFLILMKASTTELLGIASTTP